MLRRKGFITLICILILAFALQITPLTCFENDAFIPLDDNIKNCLRFRSDNFSGMIARLQPRKPISKLSSIINVQTLKRFNIYVVGISSEVSCTESFCFDFRKRIESMQSNQLHGSIFKDSSLIIEEVI